MLLAGVLLIGLALWQKDVLPTARQIRSELLQEPQQTVVEIPPFQTTAEGVIYTIKPLHRYELHGMVVSRHDTSAWWDYLHAAWNDHLNVADLCVVWGNNIRREAYRDIEFSSGQFTCNFFTRSSEAFAAFDQTAISNNHLLSAERAITRRIKDVRIGDQVYLSGYLAEYSHTTGQAFHRGTSTVRTDTGNGACETVWVEDFQIVQRGGGPWHWLLKLGLVLLLAGVVAWWRSPVRASN